MNHETGRGRPEPASGRTIMAATAPSTETRTLWLPDEWTAYIAYGEDPESPDWPIALCDDELHGLRLEGFDTVSCTDETRELGEYRGVVGTLRAYEALRTGGDEPVVRRVTLVTDDLSGLPYAGERQIVLDTSLTLTRSESQPIERLVARAILDAEGRELRVARSWQTDGLQRAWAYIGLDGTSAPAPRSSWRDADAVRRHVDPRNCVALMALKPPGTPADRQPTPYYDHHGQVRCAKCDSVMQTAVAEGTRADMGRPVLCPQCG